MRWIFLYLVFALFAVPAFAAANGLISGFVLLQNGTAVAGANVSVYSPATNYSNNTASDGSGFYIFLNLPYNESNMTPYDTYASWPSNPQIYTSTSFQLFNATAYNFTERNLTFSSNASVSGFALEANNSTVANATVFLNTTGIIRNITSNGGGFYNFSSVVYNFNQTTLYSARAQHPFTGNFTNSYDNLAVNGSNLNIFQNLTFPPGGSPPSNGTNGTIWGHVYNQTGGPVANAFVIINKTGFLQNITANASGFYNFTSLNYSDPVTIYTVKAQHPFTGNFTNSYDLPVSSANSNISQNLNFTGGGSPPPGGNGTNGTISGRVFMPDGSTPVADANVSLMGPTNADTLTNSSGYYSFTGLSWPSGFGLQARGTGMMQNKMSNFFNLNLDGSNYTLTQNLNLMDQGGGSCSHNGTYSVSGYVRVINESGTFNITGTPTQVELKARNATCSAWDFTCFYAANESNFSGFYTIGCLEAGNYSVMAFGGGGPDQQGPGLMMQPTNISITDANITGFDLNLTRDERGPQGCGQNASITGYVLVNNSGSISFLSNVNVFAGKSDMMGQGGPMGSPGDFCGGGAQTDSNGFYNITGLEAGSYMMNVMPSQGSGYSEVHLPPEQAISLSTNSSTSEKNFTLARAGFVIGYVYGNNSGGCASNGSGCATVAGAFVNIYEPRPGGAWGGGSTDTNGFFNISITPGNNYEFTVNPPYGTGYATYRISPFDGGAGVNISEGATTNISQVFGAIILRQGAGITGYVVNQSGAGIQFVSVNAHPKMMFGPGGGGEWAFGMTNGSGYFSIAGLKENSTYILEAFPDPNSNYSTASVEVQLTGSPSVNITLVRGNSVSGRVTCNGSNVSFAPVQFMKLEAGEGGPEKMFGSMEAGSFAFAMTDQSGQYSARGITAGNFSLRAELPWGSNAYNCSMNTSTVAIVAGSNEINITMPAAVTVTGKVNDSNGNNVSNAFVNAFQPSTTGGPGSGPSAFAQTDPDGNYVMRLAPSASEYIISVFPPWGSSYASQEVRRTISASTTQNFTLSSGGSIRGKLVDSSDTAIQFAFVNAFSESVRSFGFSNTQSDGSFEVRGLSSATDFRLFIQPPPNSGGILPTFLERITVVSGQATDVGTISATSSTSYLLVTVVEDTAPVQSANVHAWLPFTPYFGYCTTNSTGQCNITGLGAGTYDVFVDSAGRPPRFTNKTVAEGENSLTFNYSAVGTPYSLNGTVQNSTGGGIADAEVGVWDEATRFGMHTTANGSGFFSFSGIPAGTYRLGSRKPGYFDNVTSVTVASSNKTQNITLGSATASGGTLLTVDGWLISQSNASVATKTVLIVDAASASLFSSFNVTNSGGYYSIANVPAPSSGAYNYVLTAVMGNQTFNTAWASNASTTVNITVS